MVRTKLCLSVLLAAALLFLLAPAVFADETPDRLVFNYTDESPEVDAPQVFMAIYDQVCDIRIEGERASFTFFYENIFRSTEKWRAFSAAVGVLPLTDASDAVTAEIRSAAGSGYFIDFRNGDVYPGTASVSVRVGDVIPADGSYALYEYIPGVLSEDTETAVPPSVRPIARGLSLGADGCVSFTLTEAHDYLLIPDTEGAVGALSAYAYQPQYAADAGFFAGANVGWIVFFAVVGLALIGLVIYLVTVKVIMKRRKQQEKALPAKKK